MLVKGTSFQQKVWRTCSKIKRGRVSTYAEIASAIGVPGAARAVGNALNKNPFFKSRVPCHRVVKSDGEIGGYAYGSRKKAGVLKAEGIKVQNGKVKNFKEVFQKL